MGCRTILKLQFKVMLLVMLPVSALMLSSLLWFTPGVFVAVLSRLVLVSPGQDLECQQSVFTLSSLCTARPQIG